MPPPMPVPATVPMLAPITPRAWLGIMPNHWNQEKGGIFPQPGYDLAIVEFDDEGECYQRPQIEAVAAYLDARKDEDLIVLVFVHGWKHNARSDDDNLLKFQTVLLQTLAREKTEADKWGRAPRPVLGIFVGWRGLSYFDGLGVIENASFWNRQNAGRRVSVGSVRELLGRLRHYRNRRADAPNGMPLLVIIGHSFGGMIVYSALAQSLIEAASEPEDIVKTRFADLVLLVNPAVEAARYLPIQALVKNWPAAQPDSTQAPVFICATSKTDWATKYAFPIGNMPSLLTENCRTREQRLSITNTIGHVHFMQTHRLLPDAKDIYKLVERADGNSNPYWVVQVAHEIIPNHGDIFGGVFLEFIADQLKWHLESTAGVSGQGYTNSRIRKEPQA